MSGIARQRKVLVQCECRGFTPIGQLNCLDIVSVGQRVAAAPGWITLMNWVLLGVDVFVVVPLGTMLINLGVPLPLTVAVVVTVVVVGCCCCAATLFLDMRMGDGGEVMGVLMDATAAFNTLSTLAEAPRL